MKLKNICLYLHIHQPFRLTKLNYLELGEINDYFLGTGQYSNKALIEKIVNKSYFPTNEILLKNLKKYKNFNFSISITGTVIEQLQKFHPKALKTFKELVSTKKVEVLSETYYHSLAGIYSVEEFCEQIIEHRNMVKSVFEYETRTFRNTELVYNDKIASIVKNLGFKSIIAEGWDKILKWKSPNFLYRSNIIKLNSYEQEIVDNYNIFASKPKSRKLNLLLKNYKLSDDIAFRFSNKQWKEYPLTVEKFLHWIDQTEGEVINLFMDYETFGEHQWKDTGIMEFLNQFISKAINKGYKFLTIDQAAKTLNSKGKILIKELISWADMERDLSAWTGNKMQNFALDQLYQLEDKVKKEIKNIPSDKKQNNLIIEWRKLQTSDHFYYMSTKYWTDGDVHKYFSPYDSPYEAFINYMNILEDFIQKLDYEIGKYK